MSQLALARPLLQTKENKKKRKTIFKTKRKRKRKEILNNDLAILPSHDTLENRWYLIVVAEPERRLQRTDKNVGAENNLLNNLGFNLCVAPRSPVMRLVAYFRVVEVIKTEVLRRQVKESEWTR